MSVLGENINTLWSSLIIEELVRQGIEYFCISPGSRSTPLVVASARNPGAQVIICYDERGAAYHALGYAKGSGKPAVLICTSGTAVANYFPAVIEANLDHIPLLILSSDRPPELLETGANQTIPQRKIFGEHLRWEFGLPCPTYDILPTFVLTTVAQAIHRCNSQPAGPVQLNIMFREPLAPVSTPVPSDYEISLESWRTSREPFTRYSSKIMTPAENDLIRLTDILNRTSRGWLVLGQMHSLEAIHAAKKLIELLEWPVFADINSGLRMGFDHSAMIAHFDLLLLSEQMQKQSAPQVIVQIGEHITSKRFLYYIQNHCPNEYIVIQNHPGRIDPAHRVSWRIECDIPALVRGLDGKLFPRIDISWRQYLRNQSDQVDEIIEKFVQSRDLNDEISIARLVSQHIPGNSGLFLGNSMPIRDMDFFADAKGPIVRLATQRGASGIDGHIAGAIGFTAGLKKTVILVLGDLAFLHDLNSLSLLKECQYPVTLVLINNQGGGIFSFLQIANFDDVFERYFATPHSYTFAAAAQLFGISYRNPQSSLEFIASLKQSGESAQSSIIEVNTRRDQNKMAHDELFAKIREFLQHDRV